jgi:uncharacterized cupredoxin-like copper-binding protein
MVVPVLLAACGGDDDGESGTAPTAPQGTGTVLEVDATEMRFTPSEMRAPEGAVRVVLHNSGLVVHDFRVVGLGNVFVEASPGETSEGSWEMEAGEYDVYCSIQGHREAGMVGTLVIE